MTDASVPAPPAVRITSWVFVACAAILIVQGLVDAIPKHAGDVSWPAHARFHLIAGTGFQLGFSLAVMLIARGAFRRCQALAWWVLLVYALSFAVHVPATLWPGSGPPAAAWYLIGVMLAAMGAGLIAARRYMR